MTPSVNPLLNRPNALPAATQASPAFAHGAFLQHGSVSRQPSFAGGLTTGLRQKPLALVNRYLAKASPLEWLGASALKMRESGKGLSHFKFLQDTGVIWVPKMLVSRSSVERFEISFLEFVESAYGYYCAPFSAEKIFSPLMKKMSPNARQIARFLTKPVEQIPAHLKTKVLPVKAATILASVLTMVISGTYALHFVKNLLTEKKFRQSRFSDVINLTHGELRPGQDSDVAKKAKRRIKQCLGLSAAILLGAMALAKYGAGAKGLQRPLERFVRFFDFDYKNGAFGSTRKHLLYALFPINVAGYIDAARDKLERVEVACRTAIIGYFICDGSERLESAFVRHYGKKTPSILMKNGQVKSLERIEQEVLKQAERLVSKSLPQSQSLRSAGVQRQIQQKALALLKPRLAAKARLFLYPHVFGTAAVGLMAAGFNRVWTNYRFHKMQAEQSQRAQRHFERSHN